MELRDSVAVVTGGGSGIGAALCRRFAAEGARSVVVVDRDLDAARSVADEVGGVAEQVDVTDPAAVRALVERTLDRDEQIDLFCSNAGIATGGGLDDDEMWHRVLEVNTMAHVYAARAVRAGACSRAAAATCCRPRPPPGCSPPRATRRTRSASTARSRSPSGWPSPTAAGASASACSARWGSRRRC